MDSSSQFPAWKARAEKKRIDIFNSIPSEWRLHQGQAGSSDNPITLIEKMLDDETRTITELDCADIIAQVARGKMTAVQVTTAFCKRTAFALQMNNCVLEYCYMTAISRAKALDDHFATHGRTIGPLHGLPVSLKDQFHVKGYDTSMGYVGWLDSQGNEPGTRDERSRESVLVSELHSLGAIIIAKTSPAQTLWCAETNNNILGYCFNPHNSKLSSGGSSGGQGALLALRGTTCGFGTDVGGSVSVPAAFNKLYSIKPSSRRISFRMTSNSSPGQTIIPCVAGIMSTSLPGLTIMFRALQSSLPWQADPEVLPIPWRSELEESDELLCVAVLESDGAVSPHPPILRGIRTVKAALEARGHETIMWNPPSHKEAVDIHSAFTDADGGLDVFTQLALSNEPLIPELKHEFGAEPKPPISTTDVYRHCLRLRSYRERYHDYWHSTAEQSQSGRCVDAVIMPVAPHAGALPGKWCYYGYGVLANVLDYTTATLPITKADKDVDKRDESYCPLNDVDKKNWAAYDPEAFHGAPVGVQILGRRLDEERLLSIVRIVNNCLDRASEAAETS